MATDKNNNGTAAKATNNAVSAKTVSTASGETKAIFIPLDSVVSNDYNARKSFDVDALKELAQNIATFGLIQPVTVRHKAAKGGLERYEIICGERRFRACKSLCLTPIPAIVREATDQQAYDLSISENLQREDVPPIEAAEAYKRLIDTKRYDVATLALQFGKSEKHVYNTLKLCELIPGIAKLVRSGELTAASGIVISKYNKKIQAEILRDRLGEERPGEWRNFSAGALASAIQRCYTNNLDDYGFDKTACLKCAKNSTNYDLFADKSSCGKCTDEKCLEAKQTTFLVGEAQKVVKVDPKVSFIGNSYGRENEATRKLREAGHDFKNVQTYNLTKYPVAPTVPQATDYKKPEELVRAQERFGREQERYSKAMAQLDTLKERGKIHVYAQIGDKGVQLHYKEVSTKDTKSNEELLSDWTAKKARNSEIAKEKIAEDIKALLSKEATPQSAFTADEEAMVYYFMMKKLRVGSYKAIGLKGDDHYRMKDADKVKFCTTLTEQQKTVIRRDFLHDHLMNVVSTVAMVQGGMMLSFAKLHLPEQTAMIETAYQSEYDKKNARLDERIAELKKQIEKVKGNKATDSIVKTGGTAKQLPQVTATANADVLITNGKEATEPPKEVSAVSVAPVSHKVDSNGKAVEPSRAAPTASVKANGKALPMATMPVHIVPVAQRTDAARRA
jgi:ParB family chromosome partitioning protein